jgi:hypothetical protein
MRKKEIIMVISIHGKLFGQAEIREVSGRIGQWFPILRGHLSPEHRFYLTDGHDRADGIGQNPAGNWEQSLATIGVLVYQY